LPGSNYLIINTIAKVLSFIVTDVTNILLICYNLVTLLRRASPVRLKNDYGGPERRNKAIFSRITDRFFNLQYQIYNFND